MNLVMSDITRNKLGCYMAQQASLNNIPVSALVSRFTVEPSVQQRFENAVKESTEFTKKINVIPTNARTKKFTKNPGLRSDIFILLYFLFLYICPLTPAYSQIIKKGCLTQPFHTLL